MLKLVAAVTFAASLAASAQMDMKPSGPQSTDKEKIADALRAGPPFIVKDAVIADWPTDPKAPDAEYRVLLAGKSDWTCLPGIPGYSHDEPMCLDKTSMQWIKDSLADRPVHIDQIGVMYMVLRSMGTGPAWNIPQCRPHLPRGPSCDDHYASQ